MAEKEVLEIGVESSQAEAALGRYNALLNTHDTATEKAAASSAKLDAAITKSGAAYDNLAGKLRSAGGAVTETFTKLEASGAKVKTLNDQLDKQKNQYDALGKALARARDEFGDSAQQTSQLAQALDEVSSAISSTESDLDSAAASVAEYSSQLDELVQGDAELAAAQDEVTQALGEVAIAGAEAGTDLAALEKSEKAVGTAAKGAKGDVGGLTKEFSDFATKLSALPGPLGAAGTLLKEFLTNAEAGTAALGGMTGGIAVAGVAVAGLAVAFGVIKAGVGELVDYSEKVSAVALKTGETIEFIGGLAEAADDASVSLTGQGTSLDQVSGALEKFSRNLGKGVDENGNFNQASKITQQALKELGVTATDQTGKLKDKRTSKLSSAADNE